MSDLSGKIVTGRRPQEVDGVPRRYQANQVKKCFAKIDFFANKTNIEQLETVTFTADNNSDIVNWYWEILDGSNWYFYQGQQVQHTFRNTGGWDIVLTATDGITQYGVQYKEKLISVSIGQYTEFIFDIDTTKSGATANNEFQLPFVSNGNYSCSVDWGDGNTDVINSYNQAETKHTFSSGGVYTIKITGTFKGWSFGSTSNPFDAEKMLEVKQFGDLKLADNGGYFRGCKNLTFSNPDNLDTSYLTNFSYFFYNCQSMTTVPGMGSWDTSNGVFFNKTFAFASNFNQNINSWNVEKGEEFNMCFVSASSYNSPMDQWYTPSAKDFGKMFKSSGFNQPVTNLDPTNVWNYKSMFQSCPFNQPVNHLVRSAATDIGDMFDRNPDFNQPVDQWNVRNISGFRAMRRVFNGASSFAQDINMWEPVSYDNEIMEFLIKNTNMTRSQYDNILIEWEATTGIAQNVLLSTDLQYTLGGAAETARNSLINNYGWTIQDGGGV